MCILAVYDLLLTASDVVSSVLSVMSGTDAGGYLSDTENPLTIRAIKTRE